MTGLCGGGRSILWNSCGREWYEKRRAPTLGVMGALRYRRQNRFQFLNRRRNLDAMPSRPVPRKISELGSGAALVVGDELAKQVGEFPHAAPATCNPKSVMAVEVPAPVRSNVKEPAVVLPVVSKQRVSAFIPPQAPDENPVKLMPRP